LLRVHRIIAAVISNNHPRSIWPTKKPADFNLGELFNDDVSGLRGFRR
jgi:hypothetical protein